MTKALFAGVFFDSAEQQRILREFPPVHAKTWAHHVTLWFRSEGAPPDLPWGKEVVVRVVQVVTDETTQAVRVELPSSIKDPSHRIPHITISTTAGTPPSQSKKLLQDSPVTESNLLRVVGRIGWQGLDGRIHYEEID